MISINKLSLGLIEDTISYAKKLNDIEGKKYDDLNLNDIIQVNFPVDKYYREQTQKKQIVLHHTVSGIGVNGDLAHWLSTTNRIATAIIIDWKGNIYQCFSTKYWAHHLGVKSSNNVQLNKMSIGVEIDSWGPLMNYRNKWYPVIWSNSLKKYIPNISNKPVNNFVIYSKPFRGFYAYEKYTDEQIVSLYKLIKYWGNIYNIPLDYNDDMWDVNQKALDGVSGIWTHVSYRNDKSDCHPQSELIQMLKSLK